MKPDCNPEYEKEVLRFCVTQTEREEVRNVLDVMEAEWFTIGHLRNLAKATLILYRACKPVSMVNLKSFPDWHPDSWIPGGPYWDLLNTPSSYNVWDVEDMAEELRSGWRRRTLRSRLETILGSMDTTETPEIEDALQRVLDEGIDITCDPPQSMGDAWEKFQRGEAIIPIEHGRNALTWGIPAMDEELRCPTGSFGVVAAKTSAGKTSIAVQMAMKTANRGRKVHLISLEMSTEEIQCAIFASNTGKTRSEIERGGHSGSRDTPSFVENLTVDAMPSGTAWSRIEQRVRRLWKNGMDVLVLDYFSLLNPPETGLGKRKDLNTAQAFGEISKALRRLSQELKIAVVVVAQFNRQNEDGTEPSLSNLRETGQLEQDCTWCVLLWTDLQSIREAETNPRATRIIHARIAKNRGGRRWVKMTLQFDPALCRFSQQETDSREDYKPRGKANHVF